MIRVRCSRLATMIFRPQSVSDSGLSSVRGATTLYRHPIGFNAEVIDMKIGIVTPAHEHRHSGNDVTAIRWARMLRALGHAVQVSEAYDGRAFDMMLALHARRSHSAIRRFLQDFASQPVILALTGTDLYRDIKSSARARQSLDWASRLIVLHPRAANALPKRYRTKVQVIRQSVVKPTDQVLPRTDRFQVCVLGHLRAVKDPFRAAMAARDLPQDSRLHVVHLGAALTDAMGKRAQREMDINARYEWRGGCTRAQSLRTLRRSHVMVLSSRMEGGANVLSEAITLGVPVIASRIAGNVGLLGSDYPGYFRTGDTKALARMLRRVEADSRFLCQLRAHVRRLAPQFTPQRELRTWEKLLRSMAISP